MTAVGETKIRQLVMAAPIQQDPAGLEITKDAHQGAPNRIIPKAGKVTGDNAAGSPQSERKLGPAA